MPRSLTVGQLGGTEAGHQRPEGLLELEAGQRGAETVVRSPAEGDVGVGLRAGGAELVGPVEDLRVGVGGEERRHQATARFDVDVTVFVGIDRLAGHGRHDRAEPQHLLHRSR